uniref:LIM zinc-binding domain-containing protein n=1 Tax=Ditylenchus dipsaci TaxID=166011 RepID=A0A915DYJ1_9BILA
MSQQNVCAACAKPIEDQFFLTAIGRHWHDDCLRCICCNCRLAELGWTFIGKRQCYCVGVTTSDCLELVVNAPFVCSPLVLQSGS